MYMTLPLFESKSLNDHTVKVLVFYLLSLDVELLLF